MSIKSVLLKKDMDHLCINKYISIWGKKVMIIFYEIKFGIKRVNKSICSYTSTGCNYFYWISLGAKYATLLKAEMQWLFFSFFWKCSLFGSKRKGINTFICCLPYLLYEKLACCSWNILKNLHSFMSDSLFQVQLSWFRIIG